MTPPQSAAAVYERIHGGPELLAWFGQVPIFGDGEVVALDLRRQGESRLVVHGWIMRPGEADGPRSIHQAVVTFRLVDIIDLKLDGFNHQNVISELHLRLIPEHPPRPGLTPLPPPPEVYEIEMVPCAGLSGMIRCRHIDISYIPGAPDHA